MGAHYQVWFYLEREEMLSFVFNFQGVTHNISEEWNVYFPFNN